MIRFKTGDILAEDAEALVNTVNCVGVMGRGIALQFRKAYPENFRAYAEACRRGEIRPGRMFVFETGQLANPRYIINFPTKRHWRGNSRIEDVETGLADLVREIRARGILSIAIPPLGSGLGGLEWSVVRACIGDALRGLTNLDAVVFEPTGAPGTDGTMRSRTVPERMEDDSALDRCRPRVDSGGRDETHPDDVVYKDLERSSGALFTCSEQGGSLRVRTPHLYPDGDNISTEPPRRGTPGHGSASSRTASR